MSTIDQYKAEAMRLLDHYPLEACERVARRLNGRGWKLEHFNCKVEIFDAIRWYAKVHIKTDVTKKKPEDLWAELQAAFKELDLQVEKVTGAVSTMTEAVVAHRKYDYSDVMGRRVLRGCWYDFHVEFKPATAIDVSVLTEEEV